MALIIRDTSAFFTEGTASQFHHVLGLYRQVLRLKAETKNRKPEDLIKLDEWYQNELPKKIKSRGKDAHCTLDELIQLMKWKQARGKFYPQLSYLIKVNTPRSVMVETKKAFKKLPNLEQAITALSNLKGVGTTMASALLAAAAPEIAPFMADECLLAIPDIEDIDYTTKEYLNFVSHIQNTAERLSKEAGDGSWNPHSVELAIWTHFVARELKPELLDSIPLANGTVSAVEAGADAAGNIAEEEDSHKNGEIISASMDKISADDASETLSKEQRLKDATEEEGEGEDEEGSSGNLLPTQEQTTASSISADEPVLAIAVAANKIDKHALLQDAEVTGCNKNDIAAERTETPKNSDDEEEGESDSQQPPGKKMKLDSIES